MSRRRAVRLLGSAIAVAAVPGLRPRPAHARKEQTCGRPDCGGCCKGATVCGFSTNPGCNLGCCQDGGPMTAVCCAHDPRSEAHGSWCCPKGYVCGSGANTPADRNCTCNAVELPDGTCGPCPAGKSRCENAKGKWCCKKEDTCGEQFAECVSCRDDLKCGGTCCEEGQRCADPKLELCCGKLWTPCTTRKGGQNKCCPPKDHCSFSDARGLAACCDKREQICAGRCCTDKQVCKDGRCHCKKKDGTAGGLDCGDTCCKADETCCGGKCCKKGNVCLVDPFHPAQRKCVRQCAKDKRCFDECCTGGAVCRFQTCRKPD